MAPISPLSPSATPDSLAAFKCSFGSIVASPFPVFLTALLTVLTVVDTHPDSTHTLRIDRPFPELEQYARSLNLDAMDSMEHSHIPWVVLLVRAGCEWKDAVSPLAIVTIHDEAECSSMEEHCR